MKHFSPPKQMVIIVFSLLLASSALTVPLHATDSTTTPSESQRDDTISTIITMIDEDLIYEYLSTLVGFGPRMTGTYGCQQAAEYIYDQFEQDGLQTRAQNWSSWGNSYYHHFYNGQNIIGTLPGENTQDDSMIIFNAHYDSVAAGPGANDDGSGTAAVLAAAYVLSHFSFQRSIRFITFSGEEVGLLGSRAYAKEAYENNDAILVEINADMIGHDEGSNAMTITASEDAHWVQDVFESMNTDYVNGLTLYRGNITREHHGLSGSDYSPFLLHGYETVCCWERDHDPNFHSANDNLDNVNMSYLVNTTRMIAGALAVIADQEDIPPQVRITSPHIGYRYNVGMEKKYIGEFKTTVFNNIWVWAEVQFESVPIERAEFYYDGILVGIDMEPPFMWHFNQFSLRKHEISVIVHDELGRTASDWREIRFINILKNR